MAAIMRSELEGSVPMQERVYFEDADVMLRSTFGGDPFAVSPEAHVVRGEADEVAARLTGIASDARVIDIASSDGLDLVDSLSKFDRLERLHVKAPSFSVLAFPASLQVLVLDAFDMCLYDTPFASDLDLSRTGLRELLIAPDCDFGVQEVLFLPPSLRKLVLNRTFTSCVVGAPRDMALVAVGDDYPFKECFDCDVLHTYE